MSSNKFLLLQDMGTNMYYIAYAPTLKSKEGLKVIDSYIDERKAMEDLLSYSLGKKNKGGMKSALTLKDVVRKIENKEI